MKIDNLQDKTTSVIISNELAEIWAKFESELTILTTNNLAKGADLGLKKWHSFQQINAANFKKQAAILGEKIKQEVIGSLKGNTDNLLGSIRDEVVKYTKTKNPPIPKKKILSLVDRVNDFQEKTVKATIKQAGMNYLFSTEQIYQTTKVAVSNSQNLVKDSSLRLVNDNPLLVDSIEKYSMESAFRGQRVRYANGRSVSMRSYIEMNVRTELSNKANEMIISTCKNLGGTLFLVSEHANCAEDHIDIQGKVCTCNQEKFRGKGFLNLDDVRQKLQRPNCRHYLVPISEDQLIDLNKTKKELGTIKDNGLKGDYEDLKQQRYNERAIRHYKTERDNYLALASQMKDEDIKNNFLKKAKNADLKVKKWQKIQRELVDKNDSLIRDYDRENVKNLKHNLGAKTNDLTSGGQIGYNEEKDLTIKKLSIDNFPDAFKSKQEIENTKTFINYINNLEGSDPKVLTLYNSMGKLENIESNGIPFMISHGINSEVLTPSYSNTGKLAEVTLTIPKLQGDNLAGQVNTILHEEMHLIDLYCRQDLMKSNNWFSTSRETLVDTFKNTSSSASDDIAKIFSEYNGKFKEVENEVNGKYAKLISDLDKSMSNGTFKGTDKRYRLEIKKLEYIRKRELDYQWRNIMGGGIDNLQDIYDALSGGLFREIGIVKYGHGTAYYLDIENQIKETVANYAALSVTRPDLIKLLRTDKPDLVVELEATITEFLKRVGEK